MSSTSAVTPSSATVHFPDSQLAALRALLVTDRIAESAQREEHSSTVGELTGQTDVDSILEREVAEDAVQRSDKAIADIDRALVLIDAGAYGGCERCGSPIAFERLEAIPQARLCVGCSQVGLGLLG